MRSLGKTIKKDLGKKLVLLSGPRQCGKTVLAKELLKNCTYYNYDSLDDRKAILSQRWDLKAPLVLDEFHKHDRWKLWLKGLYDTHRLPKETMITGSARMNTFRKAGDSLAGRFFHHTLLPIDVKEGLELLPHLSSKEILQRLMMVSGFPEPFFNGDEAAYFRWRSSHLDVILKQDIIELENVRDINQIQNLLLLLTEKVGGLLSYQSLVEDLSRTDKTIRHWIEILENSYLFFRVFPLGNTVTSIKKMPKLYFYDIPRVEDQAARFENVVASALFKEITLLNEAGQQMELRFVRNKQKQEIDFAILNKKKVTHLIEAKLSDTEPSKNFPHFSKIYPKAEKVQLVMNLDQSYHHANGVKILPAHDYLSKLDLLKKTEYP